MKKHIETIIRVQAKNTRNKQTNKQNGRMCFGGFMAAFVLPTNCSCSHRYDILFKQPNKTHIKTKIFIYYTIQLCVCSVQFCSVLLYYIWLLLFLAPSIFTKFYFILTLTYIPTAC